MVSPLATGWADARPAALTNLSFLLRKASPDDALAAAEEAVAICRDLAVNPDRYRPDLGYALDNFAVSLSDLGRVADALPSAEEAVDIRRDLVAVNSGRYRPDLAKALINLSILLDKVDRSADALPHAREAPRTSAGTSSLPTHAFTGPTSPPHSPTWSYRCWSWARMRRQKRPTLRR